VDHGEANHVVQSSGEGPEVGDRRRGGALVRTSMAAGDGGADSAGVGLNRARGWVE